MPPLPPLSPVPPCSLPVHCCAGLLTCSFPCFPPCSQLGLYFWYCLSLFWNPLASPSARAHLRALLLIKSPAFALSALQLRTG